MIRRLEQIEPLIVDPAGDEEGVVQGTPRKVPEGQDAQLRCYLRREPGLRAGEYRLTLLDFLLRSQVGPSIQGFQLFDQIREKGAEEELVAPHGFRHLAPSQIHRGV